MVTSGEATADAVPGTPADGREADGAAGRGNHPPVSHQTPRLQERLRRVRRSWEERYGSDEATGTGSGAPGDGPAG